MRTSWTEKGFRTAVQGDGSGYPDLTMVHISGRILVAEIKKQRGVTTAAQDRWLEWWRRTKAEVYVWRPEDWQSGEIARILRTKVLYA